MHLVSHNNIRKSLAEHTRTPHSQISDGRDDRRAQVHQPFDSLSLFPRLNVFCIYCGFFISIIIFFVIVFTKYLCHDIPDLFSWVFVWNGRRRETKRKTESGISFCFLFRIRRLCVLIDIICVCICSRVTCILHCMVSIGHCECM